ncbi:(2Fe-2S)-binding protein [Pseudogracilibacillus auburnensis]|uniref:Carbon-monoxide dehydrogenase small subunit n=1 Tax=Pseudogracilibacillus auburnensis TaxID=1494959 RepID=A0A2V3WBY8_9BACI|nr:(2Fe-2S)-binding protein [Pseudogracilibacillus auburnensis]MBO1002371.1 (2Fe-2S)-binding protein [Pseudogracilibacillus auburnensis]PXW86239.1 carbon-monoxide dehydrogenase small subunit [Pseudogracilibacillus auburnensis]
MTKQEISMTVNGMEKEVFVRNADTLLHILRAQLGLTGAKPGCNNGDCGSCTILMDGKPLNACHMLAVEASNKHITTIEGLTDTTIQDKFIQKWALQCGYCTPGFVLNCYALIENEPNANDVEVDEWLDSNICRCTGYQEIKESVKELLRARRAYG